MGIKRRQRRFFVSINGCRRNLITIKRDDVGPVHVEVYSHSGDLRATTVETISRKYQITLSKGAASQLLAQLPDLKTGRKSASKLTEAIVKKNGFVEIFCEHFSNGIASNELISSQAKDVESLASLDPDVENLLLLCLVTHKDVRVPVGIDNETFFQYVTGPYKFILIVHVLGTRSLDQASHMSRIGDESCWFFDPWWENNETIGPKSWGQVETIFKCCAYEQTYRYCEQVLTNNYPPQFVLDTQKELASLPHRETFFSDLGFQHLASIARGAPQQKNDFEEDHCIMCNECKPLTGEHVFGQWIGKVVKDSYVSNDTVSTVRLPNGRYSSKIILGSHIDRTLPVLCDPCNTRWGSRIQNKASMIIKPWLADDWSQLDKGQVESVVRWAVCFTMVREFEHIHSVAIPARVRHDFYKRGIFPKGMSIFVIRFHGKIHQFKSRHYPFISKLTVPQPRVHNSHFTAFALSTLTFFVFGSVCENLGNAGQIENFAIRRFLSLKGFVQLWPTVAIPFRERPSVSLDDADFDKLIREVKNVYEDPMPYFEVG